MRRFTGTLTALGITAYFIAAGALTAHAATTVIEFTGEDFYIPRPASVSDQENVERLLASVEVPAELVGLTCSVAGTSANGESVHVNNYGVLRSNGDSVTISGTEDTANGVRLSDRSIILGATVDLFNVMVPDPDGIAATSVAYTVRVTCTTDDTTTTTTPPSSSTTTITSTTSSTGSTSSTLPPASTTSTTAPTGSTTTTSPSTSTSTPGSTSTTTPNGSTTSPDGSTSTTTPSSTTSTYPVDTTPPPTLPKTGPGGVAGLVGAGVALLLLGGGIALATREGR